MNVPLSQVSSAFSHALLYVNQRLLKFASAICILLLSQNALSGAWVAAEGSGYGKLSLNTFSADEFEGDSPDFGEFNSSNITYYGEYGLGNKWGLFGSVNYQWLDQTDAAGNETSSSNPGDVDIGLRYEWINDSYVLSTSVLAKLPYLYDEDDELPPGNGQEDIEFRLLFGKSLFPYGYFGLEAGYRIRLEAPSDEYRFLIEYGFDFNENLYFRTKLDGIFAVGNAEQRQSNDDGQVQNLAIVPEFDLVRQEWTLGWNFGPKQQKRWGVEATFTNDLFGDNSLIGQAFQLGLTRVF